MYYLIRTSKIGFGEILAKAESTLSLTFQRNFLIKTGQADDADMMTVEVFRDDEAASWGFQPWVASCEGPEPDDPYTMADTEAEALTKYLSMIGG